MKFSGLALFTVMEKNNLVFGEPFYSSLILSVWQNYIEVKM